MNKRIQNLAEQADAVNYDVDCYRNSYATNLEQLEKFAQLIVKECVREMGRYEFIDVAIYEVKDHFGVK